MLDILIFIGIAILAIVGLGILGLLIKFLISVFGFLGKYAFYAISILLIGGVIVLMLSALFA